MLKYLGEKDDTQHIPVIILTGADEPGMEEKSKTFGVKAIISKPYDTRVLLQKIHEVLEWKRYEESL